MALSAAVISVDADVSPMERRIQRSFAKISQKPIQLKIDDRASSALGNITGKTTKFNEALDAATARVVAFGVAAGAFNLVRKGVEELLRSTVEVESALTRININLNESNDGLKQFGKNIFDIARNTGQTFETAAKAAEELTRQGLSAEETTKRLRDALILSRLAAIDSDEAVKSLTASINSFSKEALSSSEILNKLAAVDAKFAVSTNDLAQAVSRVGSSASDAGVKFDELLAIVTSVQQTTARGGAVIGNAFKTIFTRIERSSTLDDLEALGIGVRDLEGKTLPAIQILTNLAKTYDTLSQAQRSAVAEQVGGVFQINILKAALGDLGKEYSVYQRALETAAGASDEANRKNEALNKTLASSFNELRQSLTQLFAEFGKINLNPVLKAITDGLTGVSKFLAGSDIGKDAGKSLGENIVQGIGNVLTGPGVVALAAIVQSVISTLVKKVGAEFGQAVSASLLGSGALTGIGQAGKIAQARTVVPRAASGILPSIMGESAAISAGVGGASASAKPVVIPNFNFGGGKRGAVVANTSEYIVPNYAGSGGSAIFNKNMVSAYGLPNNAQRLAQGYIPNFAAIKSRKKSDIVDDVRVLETENGSSLTYFLDKKTGKINIDYLESKKKGEAFELFNSLGKRSRRLGAPIYTSSFDPQERQISKDASNFENLLTIYPQLRYRNQSGLKTKGTLFDIDPQNYSDGAKESTFRSLRALKSKVNAMRPGDFIKKLVNDRIRISDVETSFAAGGFIPNFAGSQANYFRKYFGLGNSPLASAVSREMDAGVSPGNIYIDADKRVASRGNPLGLLVANRRDEPSGGFQGVNRVLAQGGNPKMAGLAGGYVPNFATPLPSGSRSSTGRFLPKDIIDSVNQLIASLNGLDRSRIKGVAAQIREMSKDFGTAEKNLIRGNILSAQSRAKRGEGRVIFPENYNATPEQIAAFERRRAIEAGSGKDLSGTERGFTEFQQKETRAGLRAKAQAALRSININERLAIEKNNAAKELKERELLKKENRKNNLRLGTIIGASFAAPAIEGGINAAFGSGAGTGGGIFGGAAGGALQGFALGASFPVPGSGAIGLTVGALVGAFSKLTKSAQEYEEELSKSTAIQSKSVDALQQYLQTRGELDEANRSGASQNVKERLRARLEEQFSNIAPEIGSRVKGLGFEDSIKVLDEESKRLDSRRKSDREKAALFGLRGPDDSLGSQYKEMVKSGARGLAYLATFGFSEKIPELNLPKQFGFAGTVGDLFSNNASKSELLGREIGSNIDNVSALKNVANREFLVDKLGDRDAGKSRVNQILLQQALDAIPAFDGIKVTAENFNDLNTALQQAATTSGNLAKRIKEIREEEQKREAYFSKIIPIIGRLQTNFEKGEIIKQGGQERRGLFEQTRLSLVGQTSTSLDFSKIKLDSQLREAQAINDETNNSLIQKTLFQVQESFLKNGYGGKDVENAVAKGDTAKILELANKQDNSGFKKILNDLGRELEKNKTILEQTNETIRTRNALELIFNDAQRKRNAYLNTPTLGATPAFQTLSAVNEAIYRNDGDYNLRRIQKNDAIIGVGNDIKSASGEILTTDFQKAYQSAIFSKQKDTVLSRSAGLLSSIFPSDPSNFLTEKGTPFEAKYYKERFKTAIQYSENPEQKALLREGLAQLNDQVNRPKNGEEDVLNQLKQQLEAQKNNIEMLGKTSINVNTVIDGTIKIVSDAFSQGQSEYISNLIKETVKTALDASYKNTKDKVDAAKGNPNPPSNIQQSKTDASRKPTWTSADGKMKIY